MNGQIQSIIVKSDNFLIVCDKLSRPEIFLAREALSLALKSFGKQVLPYPELPQYLFERFKGILPEDRKGNLSHTTIISIPKIAQIDEVCYEEDENNFSVAVKSKAKIEAKNLSVTEKPLKIDTLFIIASESGVGDLPDNFEIPGNDRRINITKNHIPVSKKMFDIAEKLNIDSSRRKEFATLLYAALAYETKNFRNISGADIFELARDLLNSGADKEKVSKIFDSVKSVPFSRILGRALARTHIDSVTSSSWTFIAKEDFDKSGVKGSEFIPEFLADSLHDNLPEIKTALVFFEEPLGVRCFVQSEDEKLLAKIAKRFQQAVAGNAVYSKRFENFTKAETEFKELLKSF